MSVRECETNLDCKASVCEDLKFDPFECEIVFLFGKVRLRGITFMFNTFPFGACNLKKFEVEVWKFLTYQIFVSVKPYVSIFHLA